MSFVYLMNEVNTNNYKIGMTKKDNIEERQKQLQTGNSSKIEIINYYKTDYPSKLEKMLHNKLRQYRLKGEWFYLNDEIINDFTNICDELNKIIIILKNNNPFYK